MKKRQTQKSQPPLPQCDLSVVSASLRGLANQLTIEADSIEAACAAQKEARAFTESIKNEYGPFLTVEEAAKLLKLSKATMYEWTHIDGFPAIKVGNAVRIYYTSLVEWFNCNVGKTVDI